MTNTPVPTTEKAGHGPPRAALRLTRMLVLSRSRAGLVFLAATAAVVVIYPFVASTYLLQIGFLILLYVAIGEAWNLIAGYGGMVSLGSAAFIGVGAYTLAELTGHGFSLPVSVLAGGVIAAVFAGLISPAVFRLRGVYFSVATLALAEALLLLISTISTFGGTTGLLLRSAVPSYLGLYWWGLACAALSTAIVVWLLRSRLSLSLRAIRDDQDVAQEMGVRTFRTKLVAFVLASFIMGLAGAIQSLNTAYVEPSGSFSLQWTIDIVTVVIIGGLATRVGPWIGAVFTVVLAQVLNSYPDIHNAITGVILILVIRFAPRGIWGTAVTTYARIRAQGARSG
jgi:branched-chain amino acid transport system permease protein